MNPASPGSAVVLVHGAWADGSSWGGVIPRLQRLGHQVTCAPIPLTSLADDVSALNRTLERTSGPVVLAGHAYGGAVMGAMLEDRVKSLVYIAALTPAAGETVAQVFYRDEAHPEAPKVAPDRHGLIWMADEGFRRAVAHNASSDQIAIMVAAQRPIALECIETPVSTPAWTTKSPWFLIAEDDRMINPRTQHFMATRMSATVRSHRVDHTPMLSAPDLVAEVIAEAARDVSR